MIDLIAKVWNTCNEIMSNIRIVRDAFVNQIEEEAKLDQYKNVIDTFRDIGKGFDKFANELEEMIEKEG